MRYTARVIFSIAAVMVVVAFWDCSNLYAGDMKHVHGDSTSMELSHMSSMLNNGLWMVTEGFDMVMLGSMNMAPSVDPATSEHGRQMIRSGKEVIEHFMSGPQMRELHKAGRASDALMKYIHELGGAMMKVTTMLEKVSAEGKMNSERMTMRHQYLMINHALGMAAQGSNMAILGQMSMSRPVDKFSIGEGQMMMTEASWLLKEILEGETMSEAMKGMHKKGVKMDSAMMAETHRLGEAAAKVIDLLEKMPFGELK